MRYGSVCSGIEAATVAWEPLGWDAAFYAEVETFPSAVLAHHYPDTPNLGDITAHDFLDRARATGPIDLLVGGTPCQSFSVAGLRGGLADDRGNLALRFCQIADRLRPAWVVWENVPGVLSSGGGRDFGSIVGALVELGYGLFWRILDAQHCGVPQRRRRVFLVGHLGDWRRAAAVLLERHSLSGHPPPRRETREDVAGSLTARAGRNGGQANDDVDANRLIPEETAGTLGGGSGSRGWAPDTDRMTFIPECALSLNAHGQRLDGESETFVPMAVAFTQNQRDEVRLIAGDGQTAGALGSNEGMKQRNYVAQDAVCWNGDTTPKSSVNVSLTLRRKQGGEGVGVAMAMQVRRLTPVECERLQGFPDDYTAIPYRGKSAADGPRYRALGNSMAVPVMRWIGERIQSVEDIL